MTADTTPERTLKDAFGTPRMSRRRRALVTHDGTMIARGELYPIAGEPIAFDERPEPSRQAVTFDGAVPPRDD